MFGISTKILAYVAGIAIAVLLAGLGVQTYRLNTAQADVKVAKMELVTTQGSLGIALVANQANTANVITLRGKIAEMVGKAQEIEKAVDKANADLNEATRARSRALAALKLEREKSYANDPTCRAWAGAALCPAASDGLQRTWSAASRYADRTDRSAGGEAGRDPGESDRHPAAAYLADPGNVLPSADCFTNAQLRDALEASVSYAGGLIDQLRAIRTLSDEAVSAGGK